jgi:hypothetical protein
MNDTYYQKILNDAVAKLTALAATRDTIEIELIKLRELIHATANMLSDDQQRSGYLAVLNTAMLRDGVRDASLVEAIRRVLQDARGKFLTATDVRDQLKTYGFDFSEYASNPLASISTTLRRFKQQDVLTKDIDGVAAYRWIFRFPFPRTGATGSPAHDSGMRGDEKPKSLSSQYGSPTPRMDVTKRK